jgi:glycogen synthase
VVRRTGGLADTVFDVDDDGERAAGAGHIPNGFSFEGTDSNALDYALNRRAPPHRCAKNPRTCDGLRQPEAAPC